MCALYVLKIGIVAVTTSATRKKLNEYFICKDS
jgi:hypothetical protein